MRTILIIDDDDTFRGELRTALRGAGYHALEAADGKAAVAIIERLSTDIHLMIVDLLLPDVNGIELISGIARKGASIKVIATSAVFDQSYLDMAATLGADVGMRKPPSAERPQVYVSTVRRLLGENDPALARPSNNLVLLVDDDPEVRTLLRTVIRSAGYQVLEAADGVDALAMLHRMAGAVDAIVTDITMPRMNGVELIRQARARFGVIPVVYASGTPPGSLRPGLDAENRCFLLHKPFLPGELLKAIKEVAPGPPSPRGSAD